MTLITFFFVLFKIECLNCMQYCKYYGLIICWIFCVFFFFVWNKRSTVTNVSSSFGSFMTNITRLSEPLMGRVKSLVRSPRTSSGTPTPTSDSPTTIDEDELSISIKVDEEAANKDSSKASAANFGSPLKFIRINSFRTKRPNSVEPMKDETYV